MLQIFSNSSFSILRLFFFALIYLIVKIQSFFAVVTLVMFW